MPIANATDYAELCHVLKRNLTVQMLACSVVDREQLIHQLNVQLNKCVEQIDCFNEFLIRSLAYDDLPISDSSIISAIVYTRRLCSIRSSCNEDPWSVVQWKRVLTACFVISHKFADTTERGARFTEHFCVPAEQISRDERSVLRLLNWDINCKETERQFHLGLLFLNRVSYFECNPIKINIDARQLWATQQCAMTTIRMLSSPCDFTLVGEYVCKAQCKRQKTATW
jgi:hypothetical protein